MQEKYDIGKIDYNQVIFRMLNNLGEIASDTNIKINKKLVALRFTVEHLRLFIPDELINKKDDMEKLDKEMQDKFNQINSEEFEGNKNKEFYKAYKTYLRTIINVLGRNDLLYKKDGVATS